MFNDGTQRERREVAQGADDERRTDHQDGEQRRVGRDHPFSDRLPALLREQARQRQGGDRQPEAPGDHRERGRDVVEGLLALSPAKFWPLFAIELV